VTGNLCRCGAYLNILQAGRIAADAKVHLQETSDADPTH
jgi:aerobic-type carbon monoxide dehydrogenase small subunit (CoxS/CutS family)